MGRKRPGEREERSASADRGDRGGKGDAGGRAGREASDGPARRPGGPGARPDAGRTSRGHEHGHEYGHGGRTSVAEFLARQRAGALPAGPRAELIAGHVEVPPLPRAAGVAAVVGLASRLEPQLLGRAALEFLPGLRLSRQDLLRPDLALLDASPRFGRGASRPGGETLLAVDVIRAPATKDVRLPLYAGGRVREVWLLDLENAWVEVYRAPAAGRYRSRTLWYPGETVGPAALEGVRVEVLAAL